MVDTFFLKLENNLAAKEDENMFNNEDELIEYSEKVAINYENLFCSDYLKSEMRKYIVECADVFDSKFATDYDNIYIDNWFDFINCDDFEKVENEDDDKEDNISLFSEIEEETENAVEIEIEEIEEEDEESDDEESEEEDEPEPGHEMCAHCDEIQMECECIYCTNCDEKMAVCHCIADFHNTINELGAKNANHIREKEVLIERIKFLEAMNKQDNEIMNQLTKQCNTHKLTEQTNNYLMDQLVEAREKVKEMEQLQKELDESQHNHSVDARALFKEIRISCDLKNEVDSLKIDLEEMKKERDDNENNFFEILKKKDELEIKEAEAQDALKNHKLVIERLREEAKELKNEVHNKQELFNKAIEQRDEFQNVVINKSKEINKLEHERDDLKATKDYLRGKIEEAIEKLKKQNNELDDLKSKYEQIYKDRQHFCNLNSERWDELQKTKKQLDKMTEEKKERIEELNNIIWDFKNERDDLKKKLDFKTRESDYFNKRAFDNAKEANTLQHKLNQVKKILTE